MDNKEYIGQGMTDKLALELIDNIVGNGFEFSSEVKDKEGYFYGILTAICSVFEVKGASRNEDER